MPAAQIGGYWRASLSTLFLAERKIGLSELGNELLCITTAFASANFNRPFRHMNCSKSGTKYRKTGAE
jgi:hypothetical protein